MTDTRAIRLSRAVLLGATIWAGLAGAAWADVGDGKMESPIQTPVPTGQFISPTAATGAVFTTLNPRLPAYPKFRANGAIKTAVNVNQTELLVMTTGYNNLNYVSGASRGSLDKTSSTEYVFVYDISGANAQKPKVVQVIKIPDTYVGLVYAPDGLTFYASGGVDDVIHVFTKSPGGPGRWSEGASIMLGHKAPANSPLLGNGVGLSQAAVVAGLALSPSGATLVATNIFNDSISVIDTATGKVKFEYDLRPFNTTPATGNGVPGGESPFTAAIKGEGTVYVSSIRDREIVVVDISGTAPQLVTRIKLPGSPNSMVFNNTITQDELYVTQDNADRVAMIRTDTNTVTAEVDTIAPAGLLANPERFTGAAANNLAVSPDGTMLYVTNGGANSLAVIALTGSQADQVIGLVPTGWYPNAVSVGADGAMLYVANGKSDPGPNTQHLTSNTARLTSITYPQGNAQAAIDANAANQYVFQLEQGGLLALPTPKASDLANLTQQVASNNRYNVNANPNDAAVMSALHAKIKHIIYIVKENRTYDQILGDLPGTNGDRRLAVFGSAITPNFHAISRNFVALDNFFDAGEVSGNGWAWSTTARETDTVTKNLPPNYATSPTLGTNRGTPYESEGQNRNVDVGIATTAGRDRALPVYSQVTSALPGGTANLLPGTRNSGAPDGPKGTPKESGYLWDAATRAGLTVRNYGFLLDLSRYFTSAPGVGIPPTIRDPFAAKTVVSFSTNPTLRPVTDVYFRGYDNAFPDVLRFVEWQREFDNYVTGNNLPNLTLLRLMHDHTGSFGSAIDGFNTPETQQADNDYAVGLVAQTLANSPYASDTLIFVIEDDAQDGPDHVDAHRSTAYVIGPYVKQHAVVSTRYTTVNMLRTIEDILGTDHLNLNDAYLAPMTDVFDLTQATWTYHATPSAYLRTTSAANIEPSAFAALPVLTPTHTPAWWDEQTVGFDWTAEDRVPPDLFNRITWEGLTNGAPYPTERDGRNLTHAAGE